MVRHRVSTIAGTAGCALCAVSLAAALGGCSTGEVFDAIGSSVDPYASSVSVQSDASQGASSASPSASSASSAQAAASQPAAQPATGAAQQSSSSSGEQDASAEQEQAQASHTEGEAVNIEGTGTGSTVYATWTRDGDGDWAAVFSTYNGTTLYAYQSGGSWTFYTSDGRQVVHTATSSAAAGYSTPGGVESYWQDAADPSVWY